MFNTLPQNIIDLREVLRNCSFRNCQKLSIFSHPKILTFSRNRLTQVRFAQCVPLWAFTGHEASSLPLQILVASAIMLSKYAFSESAFATLAQKLVYEYDRSWITLLAIVAVYATGALILAASILEYNCLFVRPDGTECLKVSVLSTSYKSHIIVIRMWKVKIERRSNKSWSKLKLLQIKLILN